MSFTYAIIFWSSIRNWVGFPGIPGLARTSLNFVSQNHDQISGIFIPQNKMDFKKYAMQFIQFSISFFANLFFTLEYQEQIYFYF